MIGIGTGVGVKEYCVGEQGAGIGTGMGMGGIGG